MTLITTDTEPVITEPVIEAPGAVEIVAAPTQKTAEINPNLKEVQYSARATAAEHKIIAEALEVRDQVAPRPADAQGKPRKHNIVTLCVAAINHLRGDSLTSFKTKKKR